MDQVVDHVHALVHTEHPKGFIVAPVFQEAMDKVINFIDALTRVGVVLVDPTTSKT